MSADKTKNLDYVKSITDIFAKDELYSAYKKDLEKGKSEAKLIYRHNIKKLDLQWVEVIEDCLVPLDTIVRNPRKFIVIEEDIIDISLAKSITTESVKHLAQHTNLISSVDKNGMVLPNKILNTSKEESYEVYENRFIYTLLQKLRDFVAKRFDLIKKAYLTSDEMLEISVDSAFNVGNRKMYYKQNLITALPSKELIESGANLSNLERVAKMSRIISDFFGSPFAKQMVSSAPVRPPIQRTNVILKNQDFKKALMLWQFIETYDKTGFDVQSKDDISHLDPETKKRFLDVQYLNKLLYDAITSDKELAEGVDIVIDNELMNLNSLLQDKENTQAAVNEASDKNKDDKGQGKDESRQGEDGKGQEKEDKPEEKEKKEDIEKADDTDDEDYPSVAFDVPEVINLYQKNEEEQRVKKTDIKRITLAVDRALLQKKIEQAKANKELADKLRAKRKKIEAKQKELAKKAKLDREKKKQREAMQKERAELRERQQALLAEKREERARLAGLYAQKKAATEEEKRLYRERVEEYKRNEAQRLYEYDRELQQKAAEEKRKLWDEQKTELVAAARKAMSEKLCTEENKANLIMRLKTESYKKALYKEYKKQLVSEKEDILSETARKIEAIEAVLEELNGSYGKGKKKQ